MNPIERGLRRIDKWQQRHKVPAFIVGVVKKYGDDNGGMLAGSLAHSAFISVFPLLLILVTILGLIASVSPTVQGQVLNAVARQFPLIGSKLTGNIHALHRSSVIALIVGVVGVVWGGMGYAQAGLFTMEQVWNLPGPARPGYFPRLGRSVAFLGVLGVGVIATTLLTALGIYGQHPVIIIVGGELLAVIVNIGLYFAGFRVLTPKGVPSRSLAAGAVAGGAGWTGLQAAGTIVVRHFQSTNSVYGYFGTVLGLVAWLYLAVEVSVYAAEINVVLARRLWPRSIVQPPLTEADRASMALQALQNQRREEQDVKVSFHDRPRGQKASPQTPQTPAQVSPPADPDGQAAQRP
jgi:YihY family inner membrane protein